MSALPELLDCRQIMAETGISRCAAQAIMARLPRSGRHVRRDHLERFFDDHSVAPEPTTVYLARDRAGRLLYVGITGRNIQRVRDHSKTSKWWAKSETITLEHFETRLDAERREHQLIREHLPRFNTMPGLNRKPLPRELCAEEYQAHLAEVLP